MGETYNILQRKGERQWSSVVGRCPPPCTARRDSITGNHHCPLSDQHQIKGLTESAADALGTCTFSPPATVQRAAPEAQLGEVSPLCTHLPLACSRTSTSRCRDRTAGCRCDREHASQHDVPRHTHGLAEKLQTLRPGSHAAVREGGGGRAGSLPSVCENDTHVRSCLDETVNNGHAPAGFSSMPAVRLLPLSPQATLLLRCEDGAEP